MQYATTYDDAEDIYYGPIQDYSTLTRSKNYIEFKTKFHKLGFKAPERQLRRAWGYIIDGRRSTKEDMKADKILKKFW